MKYGDVDFKDVDIGHVCFEALLNASNFPTIPENILKKGAPERKKILDELLKSSLEEVEKSENNRLIVLEALEIVLKYMDESDIWSTHDYPKPLVQKVYQELRHK